MNTLLTTASGKPNASNIAEHLTAAITSGQFEVGALLPTELELCKHYGTSRYTVRAALAELQGLGLVSRRKNVGTRVISAKPKPSFRPAMETVDDLVQFGEKHLRVLQSIEPTTVTGSLAKELGCPDGAARLCISFLRMVGDGSPLPLGWTDVYVDASYTEIGEMVKASSGPLIYSLIEDRYGRQVTEIHQDVRACVINDESVAKKLMVDVGSPALRIVRSYLDAMGEAFEVSVSVHPADRFSVSTRLHR